MKRLFGIMVGLCLLTAGAAYAEVTTGQAAPDFSLADAKGFTHALSSYKGKTVLLEWVNPECPFVKKFYESKAMQKWQADYTAKGVVWLAINSSAPSKEGYFNAADLEARLSSEGFAGTAALVDSDGTIGRLYGAQTTPHIFVIDPQGILVYQGAIDDKPSADPADITAAKNYAAAALDETLAGKPVSVASTKSYGCSVKY